MDQSVVRSSSETTNDVFVIVKSGLKEGEEVVLNPIAFVEEAQNEVLKPQEDTESQNPDSKSNDSAEKDIDSGDADRTTPPLPPSKVGV